MFQIGEVVVCVDDSPSPASIRWPWRPKKGGYYTIELIDYALGELGFLLAEDPVPDDGESLWLAERFRKVTKADDSFTEMLRACKPSKVSALQTDRVEV